MNWQVIVEDDLWYPRSPATYEGTVEVQPPAETAIIKIEPLLGLGPLTFTATVDGGDPQTYEG